MECTTKPKTKARSHSHGGYSQYPRLFHGSIMRSAISFAHSALEDNPHLRKSARLPYNGFDPNMHKAYTYPASDAMGSIISDPGTPTGALNGHTPKIGITNATKHSAQSMDDLRSQRRCETAVKDTLVPDPGGSGGLYDSRLHPEVVIRASPTCIVSDSEQKSQAVVKGTISDPRESIDLYDTESYPGIADVEGYPASCPDPLIDPLVGTSHLGPTVDDHTSMSASTATSYASLLSVFDGTISETSDRTIVDETQHTGFRHLWYD